MGKRENEVLTRPSKLLSRKERERLNVSEGSARKYVAMGKKFIRDVTRTRLSHRSQIYLRYTYIEEQVSLNIYQGKIDNMYVCMYVCA